MAKVVLYTKSYCPFCQRALALFDAKNVEYTNIDIEGNDQLRAEMIEKASGATTVPQVFINGQHLGGCDDTLALDKAGELDKLLNS